jgi:hypothetical protein
MLVHDRDAFVERLVSHGVVCGYAYDPPLDDYAGAELVEQSPDPQPTAGSHRTCFRPTQSWPAVHQWGPSQISMVRA